MAEVVVIDGREFAVDLSSDEDAEILAAIKEGK